METTVISSLCVQVFSDLEFLHKALLLDSAFTSPCYHVPVIHCHKRNPLKAQCLGTVIWYYCLWFWVDWYFLGRLSCVHIRLSAKTEAAEGLTGLDTQMVSPLPYMVFGLGWLDRWVQLELSTWVPTCAVPSMVVSEYSDLLHGSSVFQAKAAKFSLSKPQKSCSMISSTFY